VVELSVVGGGGGMGEGYGVLCISCGEDETEEVIEI
jgi:hypothetical protein